MIIINNGMYRSGSTLSFNLIRLMLEHKKLGGAYGTEGIDHRHAIGIHNADNGKDTRPEGMSKLIDDHEGWIVLKAHKLDPTVISNFGKGSSKAVYTYRHPLDIAGSLCRVFGSPYPEYYGLTQPIIEDVDIYFAIRKHPAILMLKYEDYYSCPAKMAADIAAFLGIELSGAECTSIAEKCSPARVKHIFEDLDVDEADPVTQLRGKHISEQHGAPGSHRHLVDPLSESMIREQLADYFEDAGYN